MKTLKGVEMILIDGVRYELTTPQSEAALEGTILLHHKHIFGPDSFYFDVKSQIKSKAGVVSIPDGYAIFFMSPKEARWAIIEVELASHPVYEHVIPQLSKFNRGIEDSATRKRLVEVLYGVFDKDEVLKARLRQQIKSGDVYKFISDVVSEKPLIVVAIDERTEQLNEALHDIRGDVRIVEFRTFRREDVSGDINAYLFDPICGGACHEKWAVREELRSGDRRRDSADSRIVGRRPQRKRPHKLRTGLKLRNKYKGKEFTAEVVEGGKVRFGSRTYDSVSRAAVAAIQSTGSTRGTEDGWRWWKYIDPNTGEEKLIDELRG